MFFPATHLATREMRSSLSCSGYVCRSFRPLVQGNVHQRAPAHSDARARFRKTSAQTQQPKHTAKVATTLVKTRQDRSRAPGAVFKSHNSPLSIPPEAAGTPSPDLASRVPSGKNDLSSTRPAHLDLPDRPNGEIGGSVTLKSRGTYLYQLGKAYLGFYKTGVKNIWANYKEYRDIRRRLNGTDIHRSVKHAPSPAITRREFQLYLRTKHDVTKLIPFGLVFAICGEFTPLVVLALGTAVAPYTCRIPKQLKKDLQKTLSRIEHVERMSLQKKDQVSVPRAIAYVHGLDHFGLSVREIPVLSGLLWRFWVERKLKQRIDDIVCDAILIIKEGGVGRLEADELFQLSANIRKGDTIKRLIDYHTLGIQSHIPPTEVKRTQKELQLFIDEIRLALAAHQQSKADGGYQPVSILVSAAQRAGRVGETAYIPHPPAAGAKSTA